MPRWGSHTSRLFLCFMYPREQAIGGKRAGGPITERDISVCAFVPMKPVRANKSKIQAMRQFSLGLSYFWLNSTGYCWKKSALINSTYTSLATVPYGIWKPSWSSFDMCFSQLKGGEHPWRLYHLAIVMALSVMKIFTHIQRHKRRFRISAHERNLGWFWWRPSHRPRPACPNQSDITA